jgi:hypothetical protein
MVKLKLVSIEHVLNAITERMQGFNQAFLQSSKTDANGSAFGIMLEELISRVPSPLMLQQSDDLLAFIQHTSQTTYPALQKVRTLPASGNATLSFVGQFSKRLVACFVIDSFCA